MVVNLQEVTRSEIVKSSKLQSPIRLAKSKKYSLKDFREVDFKKLFETDTFVWNANIGDYIVTISFEGPFEELKWYVKSMRGPNRIKRISEKLVASALSKALDDNDIYVNCTCADFIYRFAYQATQMDYKYGKPENRPNRYKHTNKDHNQGYVCKHCLAVLIGKRWVPSAARAWLLFMRKNVELTEFYLWGKDWKRQEDPDELEHINDKKSNNSDDDKSNANKNTHAINKNDVEDESADDSKGVD